MVFALHIHVWYVLHSGNLYLQGRLVCSEYCPRAPHSLQLLDGKLPYIAYGPVISHGCNCEPWKLVVEARGPMWHGAVVNSVSDNDNAFSTPTFTCRAHVRILFK